MTNDRYEAVIGMEIHAELRTASKMFCACPVVDTTVAEPNTAVACRGLPGAMPVVNKLAVEQAMMVGLALNCQINVHELRAQELLLPRSAQGLSDLAVRRPDRHEWLD